MSETRDVNLDAYVKRLRGHLAVLPARERDDIAREVEAEVRDRLARGERLSAVLAAMGSPAEYAERYCDAREVDGTLTATTRQRVLVVRALKAGLLTKRGLLVLVVWSAACAVITIALMRIASTSDQLQWFPPLLIAMFFAWWSTIAIIALAIMQVVPKSMQEQIRRNWR
jgi:uncharacterized membrane protein